MNSCKVAFLLLALTVSVAMSSTCTDQCGGACNVAAAECQSAVILGPVCDISLGMCNQGCAAVCGCVDTCTAQCAPAFASCLEKASGLLTTEQCYVENSVCVVDCEEVCAAQTVGATVSGAVSSIFQWIAPAASK